MSNDIEWWTKQNESTCVQNAVEVVNYARDFAHGRWSFLDPGDEDKWYGIRDNKPKGEMELPSRTKVDGLVPRERTS